MFRLSFDRKNELNARILQGQQEVFLLSDRIVAELVKRITASMGEFHSSYRTPLAQSLSFLVQLRRRSEVPFLLRGAPPL